MSRDPAGVIISARPELGDLVDLAVLVAVSDDRVRRHRLVAREGSGFMKAWHAFWDKAEDHYFTHVRPRASFDLVVTTD